MTNLSVQPFSAEEAAELSTSNEIAATKNDGIEPLRDRQFHEATRAVSDYDTFMNGIKVDIETYGIFGYMIYNRRDIQISGVDNIFITAEPRNKAPLEILTVYRSGKPYLTVYDWGSASTGYHNISELTDDFVNRFARLSKTPDGQQVYSFCFQNFFNSKINANQVLFSDKNNVWQHIYTSATKGMPAPAPAGTASGWAVLEYKKNRVNVSPWANIPHMLGIMGIQLMDKNGKWFVPSGKQTSLQELPQLNAHYKRVFAEPNISAAYANK